MANLIENPLAQSFAAIEKKNEQVIPAGYAEIKLSTKGKVGAPEVFHMRNFNTAEIMGLSLTEEENIPEKIVGLLSQAIFEKDVFPGDFHENEIVETIVAMFGAFYSPVIKDVPFMANEKDFEYLATKGPEGLKSVDDLKEGRWKPLVDVDIVKDVDTYELSDKFKPSAKITNKDTGFSCEFRLPRYGDSLLLKRWLKENFSEQEKSVDRIKKIIEIRTNMLERLSQGEDINLDRIPDLSDDDKASYERIQIAKAQSLVQVIRAMHLVKFNGESVKDKPLSERIELVSDARLDFSLGAELDKYFDGLKFGVNPEVQMVNPITGIRESRIYSFRLADILQAMSLQGANKYDVVFGE